MCFLITFSTIVLKMELNFQTRLSASAAPSSRLTRHCSNQEFSEENHDGTHLEEQNNKSFQYWATVVIQKTEKCFNIILMHVLCLKMTDMWKAS